MTESPTSAANRSTRDRSCPWRATGRGATAKTKKAVNLLRERVNLINSTGAHDNVLKIRPPLVFSKDNADLLLQKLGEVLNEI